MKDNIKAIVDYLIASLMVGSVVINLALGVRNFINKHEGGEV